MTLWLIPASGSGNRLKLIDRSFRPAFYAYGPELRLKRLAQTLAARAPVACTLTRRTDIWEARELVVLEITAQHPTQFAALAIWAFLGMLNGMGRDRGAALVLDQAILPNTVPDAGRTGAFAF